MRKVIDCSALSGPELPAFLSKSPTNLAVLTDFCVMESFQRGVGVRLSYEALNRHSGQVLVLHVTPYIARLRPRSKGLLHRLIDHKQTADFGKSCRALVEDRPMTGTNFELKQIEAKRFISELTPAAEALRSPMIAMVKKHSDSDLDVLRNQRRLTREMLKRMTEDIAILTATLYREIPNFAGLPGFPEVLHSFPFRLSVCHYALALHWERRGGLSSWPAEKLRNDITDCTYAAHASFFDGLITRDRRLGDVYNLSVKLLKGVFGFHGLTARKIHLEEIGTRL